MKVAMRLAVVEGCGASRVVKSEPVANIMFKTIHCNHKMLTITCNNWNKDTLVIHKLETLDDVETDQLMFICMFVSTASILVYGSAGPVLASID